MKEKTIVFEEPNLLSTDFALLGKSGGDRKVLELYKVNKGRVGAQVPFSKKTAQRIFGLFDTEKYIPKSFKGFIPDSVILAKDDPVHGLQLIWSVAEGPRRLYYAKSCLPVTGRYPLPELVFKYANNVLAVYAVRGGRPRPDSPLFHAPFLNVYPSGNICMGNVNIGGTDRYESFDAVIDYLQNAFFNSVFTHSNNPAVDPATVSKTIGKKRYPVGDMTAVPGNADAPKTLNDLIR